MPVHFTDLGDVAQKFGRVLVTGAAGFIGSRTSEILLDLGCEVRGIDSFSDYYARGVKEQNLQLALGHERFRFDELDLAADDLNAVVDDVDAVIHLAAMPGLVRSWTDVASYSTANVVGTSRLLECVVARAPKARFVQISTSSVYGLEATGDETTVLKPASPYGITKLAAEHLIQAYRSQHELDAVVLRYFSVYGPRQRPDMAYNIFCRLLLANEEITIYGDGSAIRSNTFVDDCVKGTIQAMQRAVSGETYNLGGGVPISVNEALAVLAEASGRRPVVRHDAKRRGDQKVTIANFDKATRDFGYQPSITPAEGLARQWEWLVSAPAGSAHRGTPSRLR
jgi:nucleoside-diphosphate-sugar epimerase